MRKILGLLCLFIALLLVYLLKNSATVGDSPLPPLGSLLNPYSGVWQNGESHDGYSDFDFSSASVSEAVDIVFDDRMVPHIYAQNLEDAMFAQGYVEAYHRLFQMDMSTRAADGKLSEVLGSRTLAYDQKQRRLGLSYAADNAIKSWAKFPELIKNLDAYTAGINYYIDQLTDSDYPVEYKLLDFEPTPWDNRRSALLLKAMSQVLAGYEEDIEMSNALKLLGKDDFKLIYPYYNPKDIPVIAPPYKAAIYPQNEELEEVVNNYIPAVSRPRSPDGVGSNNWAISGSKSATGKPMLANDPHLKLTLPSTWYEIAISTPDFSAQGVTLLGMPGIMIGFNEHIAWGETNVGHDVMDYYTISWADTSKMIYTLDGKTKAVKLRVETYNIKDAKAIKDTVKYTYWGPVVDDENDLALRWTVHDSTTTPEFMTFVHGMMATNYDDYLAATGSFYAPAQNFIYADTSGTIGLRINGALPIKEYGQGVTISKGNNTKNGWRGIIPRNENPQERNPTIGYVSSSNQWSTSTDYTYFYNGNFEAYRGRMAHRLLSPNDSFTVKDMMAMQLNTYSIEAEEALQLMLPYLDSTNLQKARLLSTWDYRYTAKSTAATLFERWFDVLQKTLWDEIYDEIVTTSLPMPDTWVTIQLMEKYPDHRFYDIEATPKQETLVDIINQSFERVSSETAVPWGKYKATHIPHLTKLPAFGSDTLMVGGTKRALNAMQETFGPSWRMVVALGDSPHAYGIYPGGQSGNPASPFYNNKTEKWANGQYDTLRLATQAKAITNPLFTIRIANEK